MPGAGGERLFALYDQIAEIEGFEPRRAQTLEAGGAGLDEALRSLLSEALYRFDTEGFVARGRRGDGERRRSRARTARWRLIAPVCGATTPTESATPCCARSRRSPTTGLR